MSIERHHTRRNKVEPRSIPVGNDEALLDADEKKTRRHRFVPSRYACRSYLQQSCTQRHVGGILLCITGMIGIFQATRNINIFVFTRRVDYSGAFPLIEPPLVIRRVSGETIMKEASYKKKPRAMGFYFRDAGSTSYFGAERLDHLHRLHMSHTTIDISKEEMKAQLHILDSKDYDTPMRDEFESGDCKAQHEWQLKSYPTCNVLHEHDLELVSNGRVKLLGSGYWRDVWKVMDGEGADQVLKTICYEHDFEDRNYERHRRDAIAMERLTASPNIVDIYAFCGNSGMFEFAGGGDLEDMLWYSDDKWNTTEKLIAAYQVASGVSDVHNVEKNGRPSIAHTDITTSQFVFVNGRYKLNDFNRCRFITWNVKKNKQCRFHIGNNPGNFRSPEEYKYESETEKIDVYSMGNVFYTLLMETWPFNKDSSKDAQRKVKAGERPHIPSRFRENEDPAVQAILKAMAMSWRQDPEERASALEVKEYLEQQLEKLNIPKDEA